MNIHLILWYGASREVFRVDRGLNDLVLLTVFNLPNVLYLRKRAAQV